MVKACKYSYCSQLCHGCSRFSDEALIVNPSSLYSTSLTSSNRLNGEIDLSNHEFIQLPPLPHSVSTYNVEIRNENSSHSRLRESPKRIPHAYSNIQSKVSQSYPNGSVVNESQADNKIKKLALSNLLGDPVRPSSPLLTHNTETKHATNNIKDQLTKLKIEKDTNKQMDGGYTSWVCHKCTLQNSHSRNFCEVCEAPRKYGSWIVNKRMSIATLDRSRCSREGSGSSIPHNGGVIVTVHDWAQPEAKYETIFTNKLPAAVGNPFSRDHISLEDIASITSPGSSMQKSSNVMLPLSPQVRSGTSNKLVAHEHVYQNSACIKNSYNLPKQQMMPECPEVISSTYRKNLPSLPNIPNNNIAIDKPEPIYAIPNKLKHKQAKIPQQNVKVRTSFIDSAENVTTAVLKECNKSISSENKAQKLMLCACDPSTGRPLDDCNVAITNHDDANTSQITNYFRVNTSDDCRVKNLPRKKPQLTEPIESVFKTKYVFVFVIILYSSLLNSSHILNHIFHSNMLK